MRFEPLHVGRPNIGDREAFLERVNDILDRRWLTNGGRYSQEFEARLAGFLGVEHCIAVCSATVGLEITIRALELRGEVIVPSFTFVATAHALQWQEITPVFADIDPATHNLDPACVEEMITPRTTGILGLHCWGRGAPVEALEEIARRHGLRLMFDASHAFGCSHGGAMIGGFGEAEVFSFHATKFINTFEGGVIATNNGALADKIRLMRNFGFVNYDQVDYVGTNGKMNEVSAAMGLTNLESLDEFIGVNRRNYECYREGLADCGAISLIEYDEQERGNWQYVVAEVDDGEEGSVLRDRIMEHLHANDVIARRYFYPGCHHMEPYKSLYPHAHLLLPKTERLCSEVLVLPTGTAVDSADIERICVLIREVIRREAAAPAVSKAMRSS